MKNLALILSGIIVLSGCAIVGYQNFEQRFGPAHEKSRVVNAIPATHVDYWQDVKPILDSRCVVCHGCYDAPCQLKFTAIEGLERGANKNNVYHTSRLTPGDLTRLFEDANSLPEWREKDFFPVLNIYGPSVEANRIASPMYQLLELKEQHPLPDTRVLSDEFTFGVSRKHTCPKPKEIQEFRQKNPLWGMPYALPGLSSKEQNTLKTWIEQGSNYLPRSGVSNALTKKIATWEAFLNQDSLKGQLVSRYIYEHLFLGHIHFDEVDELIFFKLVRSSTPPGEDVNMIVSRRPYDDPGVSRVFYRFVPEFESIVAKSHMPYTLNSKRMVRWQMLFFDSEYEVDVLPGYEVKQAANPFASFEQLPITARYKFMLDEAQFTIMNYIKGPVCRGSVALNVINDHFWVFFVDPELEREVPIAEVLSENRNLLELPIRASNIYQPLRNWLKYSKKERAFLAVKDQYLVENFVENNHKFGLNLIWDGNGKNQNAALTIFRHFDSATVEKGLVGEPPQTAWVIGYSLLERIHYLLVAGYDVYGNVGHQLLSRLHMDFLRMESESNFLLLLSVKSRKKEREHWYRGAESEVKHYLTNPSFEKLTEPDINYKTDDHKRELYALLKKKLAPVLTKKHQLSALQDKRIQDELQRLAQFSGANTNHLAENTIIEIFDQKTGKQHFVTVVLNIAHSNITSMLKEGKNLLPEENTVSVVAGILGAYPNAFMRVERQKMTHFVDRVLALQSEADYASLMDDFGVRRTDPDFWQHSDAVHNMYYSANPIEYGLLDYNRLENR